jgi:hypothetical protein
MRDDLRIDASEVVTVELTLFPSAISVAPVYRLPRLPELLLESHGRSQDRSVH